MQLRMNNYLMRPELQKDWNRLGEGAFEFEVLEELEPGDGPEWDPRADLEALEELWLEKLERLGPSGATTAIRRPSLGQRAFGQSSGPSPPRNYSLVRLLGRAPRR